MAKRPSDERVQTEHWIKRCDRWFPTKEVADRYEGLLGMLRAKRDRDEAVAANRAKRQ